jgi:hypothetical protein
VTELYSLIRFLRIYPYAHYFCNKCDCSSLDYPFTKVWCCLDDVHSNWIFSSACMRMAWAGDYARQQHHQHMMQPNGE